MKHAFDSIMFMFAACGGSGKATDPGAGNDGGSGTKTLTVVGSARAEANLVNAQNFGEFTTRFDVHCTLNGIDVTAAAVTMTSTSGVVTLTHDGNGDWVGTSPAFDEVYILDITAGADTVTGVRVDGPDIHTFTAPTAGASVDSTMPLDIAWSRDDTADTAAIRTGILDQGLSITDSGAYQLPAGSLRAERDQVRENSIRITRTNRVTPVGAAGGSEMSVSISNSINVLAKPNPAL
jgi:hypothetical protein